MRGQVALECKEGSLRRLKNEPTWGWTVVGRKYRRGKTKRKAKTQPAYGA